MAKWVSYFAKKKIVWINQFTGFFHCRGLKLIIVFVNINLLLVLSVYWKGFN